MEIENYCLDAEDKYNNENEILQSVVIILMVRYFQTDSSFSLQEIINVVYSKNDTIAEAIKKTLGKGIGKVGTYPQKAIKLFEQSLEISDKTKEIASIMQRLVK